MIIVSDIARGAEEWDNDLTDSRLGAARTQWTIIFLALFTGVWALGWAVFCYTLLQGALMFRMLSMGDNSANLCMVAFALYLLVIVFSLLGLSVGWKGNPDILVDYLNLYTLAPLCLLTCRLIMLTPTATLQATCKGFSLPKAWCILVMDELPIDFTFYTLVLEAAAAIISASFFFKYRRSLDQANIADGFRSQNQYQLKSHPQRRTGSASRYRIRRPMARGAQEQSLERWFY